MAMRRTRPVTFTMTPDNPLLKAVIAQPDDDTLRLATADWCDENDQPARAEFIRVQVELARGVADRVRRNELEVRQRDLLVENEADWVRPLAVVLGCRPGEWGGWVFRRGFVEYFRLRSGTLVSSGAGLAKSTPLLELNLEDPLADAVAEVLITRNYLSGIRRLYAHLGSLSAPVRKRFHKRFAAVLR